MNLPGRILHWAPRLICIAAIAFMSLFAFDSFRPDNTIWENILSLIIHLLPSVTLAAILVIAWKWEFTGGIILAITGLAWTIFIFLINYQRTGSASKSFFIILGLGLPFIIAGILFIISYFNKQK